MKLLVKNGLVLRPATPPAYLHVLIEDHRIRDLVATVPADFVPDETLDATGSIDQLLFAGKKRMAA